MGLVGTLTLTLMRVYTYIHTYMHTYMYTYIHTYTQTYVYTYVRTHTHTHTHLTLTLRQTRVPVAETSHPRPFACPAEQARRARGGAQLPAPAASVFALLYQ